MDVARLELQAFTWNGLIFSKVWTQGCNFKCKFCNVPETIGLKNLNNGNQVINEIRNSRVMNGVCISGGEPTIHKDLPIFIKKLQLLGLKIMLETNGSNPEMIEKITKRKLVDYIRLDIKAPPEKYEEVSGSRWDDVKKSIDILNNWSGYWEVTTVWHPLLNREDLVRIGTVIPGRWVVIKFQTEHILDESINRDVSIDEEFLSSINGPREIWVRTPEHERRIR